MLAFDAPAIELTQAAAVAIAEQVDDALRAAASPRPLCLACGRDVDQSRLNVFPFARRCTDCAGIPCLARRASH